MRLTGQARLIVVSMAFGLGLTGAAEARRASPSGHGATHPVAAHGAGHGAIASRGHHGRNAAEFGRGHGRFAQGYSRGGGGIQCVTFARSDSGIELSGNAVNWWDNAAGLYERGARPEAGAVLNFRANGAMRLGHVAVVSNIVNSRTIEIDHANWGGPGGARGGISRSIEVVDVSPANDWSAVRVGLGHSGDFGSIYPTFGFIYNRPDRGVMVANSGKPDPVPALNPAPRDLRPSAEAYDEVAEMPDDDAAVRPLHHRHGRPVVARHHAHHHHR